MAKKKRIRDLKRPTKDHPHYRKIIDELGWVPHVLRDSQAAYWDGSTILAKDGRVSVGISDPAREALITMMLDGIFGEDVKDAFLDLGRSDRIRDDLLTWPNREMIAREGLQVLELKRQDL